MNTKLTKTGAIVAATLALVAFAGPVSANSPEGLRAVVAVDSTAAPDAGSAWVRVLHASPDAPAVDVKVDGANVLTDVAFGTMSDYLPVPAGTYNVRVCVAGTSTCVIDADLSFADGKKYTVAATDLVASIDAQILEDAPAADGENAQARVVHFSADTPAVDVLTQDGATEVVDNLAYPSATDYLALPAGTYDLKVCAAADNSVCPLDPGALDLAAGKAYSVFAIGALATVTATQPNTAAAEQIGETGSTPALRAGLLLLIGALALIGTLRLAARRVGR